MKQFGRYISMLALSVSVVTVMAAAPAFAVDDQGSSRSERSVEREGRADDDRMATQSADSVEVESDQGGGSRSSMTRSEKLEKLEQKAAERLEKARQNKQSKGVEARQKACEARKKGIVTRGEKFSERADRHIERLDGVYAKVAAYQTEKNLNAANLSDLKTAVEEAQQAATAAAAVLADFNGDIDCTSQDPAASVAVLKESAAGVRLAVQDYREALKEWVKALKDAAPATESDDTTTENSSEETN